MLIFKKWQRRAKEFIHVLSPYFQVDKKTERKWLIWTLFIFHVVELILIECLVRFAHSIDNLKQSPNQEGSNFTQLRQTAILLFLNLTLNAVSSTVKKIFPPFLESSIEDSLNRDLLFNHLLKPGVFDGVNYIDQMHRQHHMLISPDTANRHFSLVETTGINDKVPLEIIIGTHVNNISKCAGSLTIDCPSRIISALVSIYALGRLTRDYRTSFIYGIFGALYPVIMIGLETLKKPYVVKETVHRDAITGQLTHLRMNATQVLSLNGEEYEKNKLMINLESIRNLSWKLLFFDFLNGTYDWSAWCGMGPLLAAIAVERPNLFTIPENNSASSLMYDFQVLWMMANLYWFLMALTSHYPLIERSLSKVSHLQNLCQEWEILKENRPFELRFSENQNVMLRMKDFSVEVPDIAQGTKTIVAKSSIELPIARYRLVGNSNAGKSTTLKALMGLWPDVVGQIRFACKETEVRFLPQEPYLPLSASLLQCILYPFFPSDEMECHDIKSKVALFLDKFNLSHLKDLIDVVGNYQTLSRGEQQRLALIGAILHSPKVLIMDEPTASIDSMNVKIAVDLLKEYLPQTLILFVSHDLINANLNNGESALTEQELYIEQCSKSLKLR